MVINLSAPALGVALLAVAIGAAAQATTGFGFSLIAAPVLVVLIGPAQAVRLTNILAVGINLVLLARHRRSASVPAAFRLLIPAVVVTPVAAYVVHRTDPPLLSVVVGILIVVSALAVGSGVRSKRLRGSPGALVAGALSAAMNTASGVGGPAVAMYALNAGWPAEMTRSTLQIFFLGLNVLSFVALGAVSLPVGPALALGAALVGGLAAGSMLVSQLTARSVRRVVVGLALAGGVAAIVRGLTT
jgi:uncharacterized protein